MCFLCGFCAGGMCWGFMCWLVSWLEGCLVCVLAGQLVGGVFGFCAGLSVGWRDVWFVCWLVSWLEGCLVCVLAGQLVGGCLVCVHWSVDWRDFFCVRWSADWRYVCFVLAGQLVGGMLSLLYYLLLFPLTFTQNCNYSSHQPETCQAAYGRLGVGQLL